MSEPRRKPERGVAPASASPAASLSPAGVAVAGRGADLDEPGIGRIGPIGALRLCHRP